MIISVIIPTYNRAKYLFRALESLIGQDFPPGEFEVIAISDGSTDETDEIVEKFIGRLDIKYLKNKHQGVSPARNAGIAASRGEVLAFFDDDAVADRDWLENISRIMAREYVIVGRGRPLSKNIWQYFAPHYDRGDKSIEIGVIWECNMAMRREVFNAVGLFNEAIGWGHEGNEFALRLRGKYAIVYRPEVLVYHDYAYGLWDYLTKQKTFGEKLIYLKRAEIKNFRDLLKNYVQVKKIGKGKEAIKNKPLEKLPFFKKILVKIIAKIGSYFHFIGSIIGYFKYIRIGDE